MFDFFLPVDQIMATEYCNQTVEITQTGAEEASQSVLPP